MILRSAICLFALLITGLTVAQSQRATVKEYNKVFKTYGFSDPDPIARIGSIYPYYRFDGYTDVGQPREWKVVELENDYVRVMILPEIGGKIWGAWEKSTGKPFIYYNQVVKFRDVAMRGPWTSGGIEANYGIIGHTPNCATPVDYKVEQKTDGSVSCYIGTLDRLTRTYWTIEINVPPDKAYFTTTSSWHNPTPLEQSYYTWMNVGIKASGNLEFVYPGNRYIGHEGEFSDWPIHPSNGRNLAFYEKNDFGGYKSYHVFGRYTDFFGAYWHDDHLGMGRYAPHDEKAGKKIWIWGLSQQGMIWEKLLTDTDGQYVEVQSGRLFNQASSGSTFTPFKHLGFAPGASDTWTEYWFPVTTRRGFVKANSYAAINVINSSQYVTLEISPLQKWQATLQVFDGERKLYEKEIDAEPLKLISDSIAFTGNPTTLRILLGNHLLEYNSDPTASKLQRPVESPEDFDWKSAYGHYMRGREYLRQRYYVEAENALTESLDQDPHFVPALTDLSMLKYRRMAYAEALQLAKHALSVDTYDPAANFYYALANTALGNDVDAKDGFDIASLSPAFRDPAYSALSKLYLVSGDWTRAAHYAGLALSSNAHSATALQLLAVVCRLQNDRPGAERVLDELEAFNPLNHFVRFERYRWQPSPEARHDFTAMIRHEIPAESYLELADWYHSIGRFDESLAVLELAPDSPMVNYWKAYVLHRLGKPGSMPLVDQANELSPSFVFPFRSSSAEVLAWVTTQSKHWKPRYYLALIHWDRNNLEDARELFAQCGEPPFAPFYASRALLEPDDGMMKDLKKAASLDPNEWRYGKMMIEHLLSTANVADALSIANEYHQKHPGDFRITMLLARALLRNNDYAGSLKLLKDINILPYEGATDGREMYREACLLQAVSQIKHNKYASAMKSVQQAQLWPPNLGVGKPYEEDIDTRLENYLEAMCLEKRGQVDRAEKLWLAVANSGRHYSINTLASAMALRKLNRQEDGLKLLTAWTMEQPNNELAQWCLDVYRGDPNDAEVARNNSSAHILEALTN